MSIFRHKKQIRVANGEFFVYYIVTRIVPKTRLNATLPETPVIRNRCSNIARDRTDNVHSLFGVFVRIFNERRTLETDTLPWTVGRSKMFERFKRKLKVAPRFPNGPVDHVPVNERTLFEMYGLRRIAGTRK